MSCEPRRRERELRDNCRKRYRAMSRSIGFRGGSSRQSQDTNDRHRPGVLAAPREQCPIPRYDRRAFSGEAAAAPLLILLNRYSNRTSPDRSDGDQNTHCQPKSDGEKAGGARIEPVQPISIVCANASSCNQGQRRDKEDASERDRDDMLRHSAFQIEPGE